MENKDKFTKLNHKMKVTILQNMIFCPKFTSQFIPVLLGCGIQLKKIVGRDLIGNHVICGHEA